MLLKETLLQNDTTDPNRLNRETTVPLLGKVGVGVATLRNHANRALMTPLTYYATFNGDLVGKKTDILAKTLTVAGIGLLAVNAVVSARTGSPAVLGDFLGKGGNNIIGAADRFAPAAAFREPETIMLDDEVVANSIHAAPLMEDYQAIQPADQLPVDQPQQ